MQQIKRERERKRERVMEELVCNTNYMNHSLV